MPDTSIFEYQNLSYKLRVIKEWRSNTRYSLGSKFLTIRIPKFYPKHLSEFHIEAAYDWARQQIDKRISQGKTIVLSRKYIDGDVFKIRDRAFRIRIIEKNIKQFAGKVIQNALILECPLGKSKDNLSLSKLVSRVMGKYFKAYIEEKVNFYNDLHFQEEINTVRLKNNKSNWGSCSSNRNLNFSTRLLFAPEEVVDYVVIHELAHLKEMNHSSSFWNIVRAIKPNYKEQERWLKENHHLCDF